MSIEFQAWPKTPRLFRNVVITEKIDGTNAAVVIRERTGPDAYNTPLGDSVIVAHPEGVYEVGAQSRNRVISPAADNAGFARWVWDNADQLVNVLGAGYHFGEWWGSGINRAYGLPKGEKRFSLFNTARWTTEEGIQALEKVPGLYPVPVLYTGVFSEEALRGILGELRDFGSPATGLGFKNPEGVCVFHTQSRQVYKVLLENDAVSKTEAGG